MRILKNKNPQPACAVSHAEKFSLALLFLCLLVLRVAYIFRFRYDSDEPQHLHVAWAWSQGLLQYRDVFDNHTPLFHMLFAPLVWALGERADILWFMRFAIVPFSAFALWCVYRMAARLFSPRIGVWAGLLAGLFPYYFFPSLEFRTDNLWAPLWLLAITVLIDGAITGIRIFSVGFIVGVCFCISMKTSLLLACAFAAAALLAWMTRGQIRWRAMPRFAIFFLAGASILPAVIIIFFTANHAWQPFINCTIRHNILPGVDARNSSWRWALLFPILLPCLWFVARQILQFAPDENLARRRAFIFLMAGLYIATLDSFWTLLTRQDYLPYYPLAAVILTPALFYAASFFPGKNGQFYFLIVLALGECAWVLLARPLSVNGTKAENQLIADVLKLTKPTDRVLDFKGESIFRERSIYNIFEPFTMVRIRKNLLDLKLAESLRATHTCVAVTRSPSIRLPKKLAEFLANNYVPINDISVTGKFLKVTEGETLKFDLLIPARYAVVCETGRFQGFIDGIPYHAPLELKAGTHGIRPLENCGRIVILWADAVEHGFSPFANAQPYISKL